MSTARGKMDIKLRGVSGESDTTRVDPQILDFTSRLGESSAFGRPVSGLVDTHVSR